MKFEFVEFYPYTPKNRGTIKNKHAGTIHIYAIDCKMDIRGIRIITSGDNVFFDMPHCYTNDGQTGKSVKYPIISWTEKGTHEGMMNWLHTNVKPIIQDILKSQSKESFA